MEWLDSLNLPPQLAGVATFIFVAAGAVFAAWSRSRGKREGVPQPKVQEFYASGQLSDMGPVKELVAQQGLLVQQQVRTNIVLERLAIAAETAVAGYQADREEQDREDEVERRVAERLAEEGVTRRSRTPRKAE